MGRRIVLRVIRELLFFDPQRQGTDLHEALEFLMRVTPHRAIAVIISDFIGSPALPKGRTGKLRPQMLLLESLAQAASPMLRHANRRHDVVVVQIADPYELELPAAATNDLRDIKPPVEIPNGWVWVWWGLGTLALAALLFFAWRYRQKRRAEQPLVLVIPAHVRAKQKLQEALALIAQPRQFCILVSDTVRWYLEERFDFRAPERTTEEFLYELQGTNLLTPDQKGSLGEFLNRCDL